MAWYVLYICTARYSRGLLLWDFLCHITCNNNVIPKLNHIDCFSVIFYLSILFCVRTRLNSQWFAAEICFLYARIIREWTQGGGNPAPWKRSCCCSYSRPPPSPSPGTTDVRIWCMHITSHPFVSLFCNLDTIVLLTHCR